MQEHGGVDYNHVAPPSRELARSAIYTLTLSFGLVEGCVPGWLRAILGEARCGRVG